MNVIDVSTMDIRWLGQKVSYIFEQLKLYGSKIKSDKIMVSGTIANYLECLSEYRCNSEMLTGIENVPIVQLWGEDAVYVGNILGDYEEVESGVANKLLYKVYHKVGEPSNTIKMYGLNGEIVEITVIL